MSVPNPPAGVVTFLYTDIEGSTRWAIADPAGMAAAQESHDRLLKAVFSEEGGFVFRLTGDGFCVAFASARQAVAAAVRAQRALASLEGLAVPLRVRMGIHSGDARYDGQEYHGFALHRVARLMASAHGGQVLVSSAVRDLLTDGDHEFDYIDLGVHRLRDLEHPESIFQVVAEGLARAFPPLRYVDTFANNLPQPTSTFVGRRTESSDVKSLLERHRLVTLTGPGGTGKTRLAIQIGRELLSLHPDGVWFVELAGLGPGASVAAAVADAVGLREHADGDFEQTVADHLQDRRCLVILDNCEHLLSAVARLASTILRSSRHVRILCTSREQLGIAGEANYRTPTLEVPDLESAPLAAVESTASVELFVQRATQSRPDFRLNVANVRAVVEIVRQLDGIPLAIELAAARVSTLSAEEIAGRLEDRFRLLTKGDPSLMPRQRTLRATLDWDFELLEPSERALLRRVGVFAGGFSLDGAELVAADETLDEYDVIDIIARLVDKSLVVADQSRGTSRYRLLETVRQYALEKLEEAGEELAVRERFASYVETVIRLASREQFGPDQVRWLDRLSQEHDNLRAAIRWCLDQGRAEQALRVACDIGRYWEIRGHLTEGAEFLREGLARLGAAAEPRLRARALKELALIGWRAQDLDSAAAMLAEAYEIARGLNLTEELPQPLMYLALVDYERSRLDSSAQWARACLDASRAAGAEAVAGGALNLLGLNAMQLGALDEAEERLREALSLWASVGHRRGLAIATNNLAQVAYRRGDLAEALRLCQEARIIAHELVDWRLEVECLIVLCPIHAALGDDAELRTALRSMLEIERTQGFAHSFSYVFEDMAVLAWGVGRRAQAATLLGAASSPAAEYRPAPALRQALASSIGALRAAIAEEPDLRTAYDFGQRMTTEVAIDYASGASLVTREEG
jgi:predicted ATPase/class 3 adenylate cyclase